MELVVPGAAADDLGVDQVQLVAAVGVYVGIRAVVRAGPLGDVAVHVGQAPGVGLVTAAGDGETGAVGIPN